LSLGIWIIRNGQTDQDDDSMIFEVMTGQVNLLERHDIAEILRKLALSTSQSIIESNKSVQDKVINVFLCQNLIDL
jgi:hypothetical protein